MWPCTAKSPKLGIWSYMYRSKLHKLLLKWALIQVSTCNYHPGIAFWSWRLKKHIFEKNTFESSEILDMTKIQCRRLYPWIRGDIIVSHRRHTVFLLYLLLQMGLSNKASRRTRVDRNRQFRIFFDISTFTIQIDVSIWNRPPVSYTHLTLPTIYSV